MKRKKERRTKTLKFIRSLFENIRFVGLFLSDSFVRAEGKMFNELLGILADLN